MGRGRSDQVVRNDTGRPLGRHGWAGAETQTRVHTHVFLFQQLRGSFRKDTPVATSTPAPRYWFLKPFSNERNQGLLEDRLILGLQQEIYRTILECLTVCQKGKQCLENTRTPMPHSPRQPPAELLWPKLQQFEQIKMDILKAFSKYP